MYTAYIYFLFLAFGCLNSVIGRRTRKDCNIPRGILYDRATFRLQYGDSIDPLARGQSVRQYHRVVVVCNKDILTDLIIKYHVIMCHRGRWKPWIPSCTGPKNCNNLEPVENATSEVLLGNDVDYPHGTVVRYACNEEYTLEGHKERHCINGVWDDVKFTCTKRQPKISELKHKACPTNIIENGEALQSSTKEQYIVTCDEGFNIEGSDIISCENGIWSLPLPECVEPKKSELKHKACPTNIIENGEALPSSTQGQYIVKCDEGFSIKGSDIISCENGIWSLPLPECVERICESLQDSFEIMNGIGSDAQFRNGSVIRIQCRWSWFPKGGITEAACINGEWKPKKPYCIVFCKIPRRSGRVYYYLSSGDPVGNRVANHATVVQHCSSGPARSSRSTCTNGRWRPSFKYCPAGRRIHKSFRDNCTVPDNPLATYINELGDILESTEKVPDDFQLTQVCVDDSAETVFSESNSSFCYAGRWIPAFQNCSNNRREADIQCKKPAIKFAILLPELELYYVNETVEIHCHKERVGMRENITCLESGEWSTNVSCEATEEASHCLPAQKAHMVYWPVKDIYEVNDSVTVLACGKGLVHAGSSKMQCASDGTWEGDFECLSPCDNGRLDIISTSLNYFDLTNVASKVIGWLDSIKECAKNCASSVNFSCHSIKVFRHYEKGSVQFFCTLLSDFADQTSDNFVSSEGARSKIYNVKCDNTCLLPAEDDVTFTDFDGRQIAGNDTFPDGTILTMDCTDKQKIKEKQMLTCIAGRWSILKHVCN